MSTENEKTWLDELGDTISEMLADPKAVKFNTHRNRKNFTGKLLEVVRNAVIKNTGEPTKGNVRPSHQGLTITRPNPNAPKGYAVMDEGLSARGDEVLEAVNAKRSAERSGVRKW